MAKKTLLQLILLWMIVMSAAAQSVYDVTAAGAIGNGIADDAQAIQRAIDRCSAEGGGRVLLPRNHTFMAGPIQLKSNVELYLEATATLKANPDESSYKLSAFGQNRGEGMLWLWAEHAENISICGKGTIHGNGIAFMGAERQLRAEAIEGSDFRPTSTCTHTYRCEESYHSRCNHQGGRLLDCSPDWLR